MAKNYTFAEACAIINEGTNHEAIADIGRRYPILLHKVSQVTAVAGDKFVDLMGYMPDYLTANKVNSALKTTGSNGSSDESDDATEDEEAETTTEAGGMPDYDSMSAKQLWDILGKAGKRKSAKSTKKADLVAACKALHENGSTEAEDEDEAEAETEETSSNPYEGKSAMDLFKECKKRGIKAAPKKAAKYYVDLLTKADAEANETESEDEDWGEDEAAEEPKETKAPKKGGKAKDEKKSGKKISTSDDNGDDDWDI